MMGRQTHPRGPEALASLSDRGIVSPRPLREVVLVGRPNVGKSTLFNRLTGTRRSIVTSIPGTTRDVITHPAEWGGVHFQLTDTGGLFGASQDPLHELVKAHGAKALKSADLIVFVVDGREGLIPGDEDIAKATRDAGVPVIVAINKSDDRRARNAALEFSRLGFDRLVDISAEHGQGVGDLLEVIVDHLEPQQNPTCGTPGTLGTIGTLGGGASEGSIHRDRWPSERG